MNPSPIPPGALSVSGVLLTAGLSLAGRFDGHPWALVAALAICALLAGWRSFVEYLKGRGGPPAAGAAAVAVLLLLSLPAHAGPPESTPRAAMPADIAAPPPAVPPAPAALTEAARVQAIVSAALASAQQGVATMPPSWMDSKAGQVLVGCIAGAIVITSAAGAGIGAGLAFGK